MAVSQLKKLRAAARENNLIGQSKSRKRQSNTYKSKQEEQKSIQAIRDAFNPFNTKVNRQKRQVLGLKTETGRPALKKQMEEKSRKVAFEAELNQHNRVGGMVDRRFGENNPSMSYEEKMQERFTREHQMRSSRASSKRSIFNLEDDNEEMDNLFGPKMRMRDDFDEGDLGVENMNGDDIGEDTSSEPGFKDFRENQQEPDPNRKKSKAEVMKEIIAKSKLHKFERQQAKLEDEQVIAELDEEEGYKELLQDLLDAEHAIPNTTAKVEDEYEKSLRELAFDRRSQPSDRTLTKEEQEKAEQERLDELIKQREMRMRGEGDDIGPDDIDFDDGLIESDEDEAQKFGFKVGGEEEDSEDEDENNEESDNDDENDGSEQESDEEKENGRKSSSKDKKPVDECPGSLDEIKSLFSKSSIKQQVEQIRSILKNYAPNRAEGNKAKLAIFTCSLFDYVCWLAGETNEINKDVASFDDIVIELRKLSNSYSSEISEFIREKLTNIDVSESLDDITNSELFLFILIGIIYSTSDHYHLISTPSILIISSKLSRYTMTSYRGIFAGLVLAQTALKYQRHSKRYIPEVVNFLIRALASFTPKRSKSTNISFISSDIYGKWAMDKRNYRRISLNSKLSIHGFMKNRIDGYELVSGIITTILSASSLWKDLSAYREIFDPFLQILDNCQGLSNELDQTKAKLIKLAGFAIASRKPLCIQSHRPLPIKTVAPQFDENYNLDRKSYNIAPEQAEHMKLKAELKKEKKGLLRDIRKDSKFMAREKLRRKMEQDSAYHDKLAKLERSIQTEEGTEKNRYEREKRGNRKR